MSGGGRRFGGAHSPGGSRPPSPGGGAPAPGPFAAVRRPWSLRALGLFLAPAPLALGAVFRLVWGDGVGFLALGGAWAALMLAAWLTLHGVRAARAYEARAVAKPPAMPRKLVGAALSAAGVGAAALFGGVADPTSSAVVALIAGALHVAAFGPDPMRSKGVNGLEGESLDAAIAKIDTARALIDEMTGAVAPLRDRELSDRVDRLAKEAEALLDMIERDPSDIRRARRLLSVYLVGARDAAVKYAQTVQNGADPEARAEYLALLSDLETHVAKSRAALSADERTALDVEIEVLRDRLRMEGV